MKSIRIWITALVGLAILAGGLISATPIVSSASSSQTTTTTSNPDTMPWLS